MPGDAPMAYRGSRKHILDWVGEPQFREGLLRLASPAPVRLTDSSDWAPRDGAPREVELGTFGPAHFAGRWIDWRGLRRWWLAHGGKTPTWDLIVACKIAGQPGLLLVEAKANARELSRAGTSLAGGCPLRQRENHQRIGAAIEEARGGLAGLAPGAEVNISRDSHYQLANRLAFAWKLATLGVPTVLVYLGFLGDEGIRDAGEPFPDEASWTSAFRGYAAGIVPTDLLERRLDVGAAPCWVLVRSRRIIEASPPRPPSGRVALRDGPPRVAH